MQVCSANCLLKISLVPSGVESTSETNAEGPWVGFEKVLPRLLSATRRVFRFGKRFVVVEPRLHSVNDVATVLQFLDLSGRGLGFYECLERLRVSLVQSLKFALVDDDAVEDVIVNPGGFLAGNGNRGEAAGEVDKFV